MTVPDSCASKRTVDVWAAEYRNVYVISYLYSLLACACRRKGHRILTPALVLAASIAHADSLDQWFKRTSGVSDTLAGITYANGNFVCVGQNGRILISSNAVAWQNISSGVTSNLLGVAYADGQFIAVGVGGMILKSTTATNWTPVVSGSTNQLNAVARCNGLWVATGNTGTLLTSVDGNAWTARNSGTTRSLMGCAFGNNIFLAVGQGLSPAAILTSSNAIHWVDRSAVNLGIGFYGVTFGGGVFVAMDARGTPYTSTHGSNWSHTFGLGGDYIFGSVYAQHFFVGAGGPFSGGSQRIVTSPDGFSWKARSVNVTNSASLRSVTYGNGYFVAVGDKGLIIQSGPVATLRVTGISNGAPTLLLEGEKNRAYRIQATDLTSSNWTDILTVTNTSEAASHVDRQAANGSVRLYRTVTP